MTATARRQGENPVYQLLVDHYEKCFEIHGPTAKGVDWPNDEDAQLRHHVMQSLWREDSSPKITILDVGCGYGAFFEYLSINEPAYRFEYRGVDLSEKMIRYAETKYPKGTFEIRDILDNPLDENSVDYAVLNGVLTEKLTLSQQDMTAFSESIITAAFKVCRKGIAFNLMSTHVDTERPDLFHLSIDQVTTFLVKSCSRHFIIRHDYGLFEYTVYAYKNPSRKTRR
jgi:SAM-dependent methyltransferase